MHKNYLDSVINCEHPHPVVSKACLHIGTNWETVEHSRARATPQTREIPVSVHTVHTGTRSFGSLPGTFNVQTSLGTTA